MSNQSIVRKSSKIKVIEEFFFSPVINQVNDRLMESSHEFIYSEYTLARTGCQDRMRGIANFIMDQGCFSL
jgi:hypothetical protein